MAEVLKDWDAFVTPREGGVLHMDLAVDGVHCAACMAKIERGLAKVPGITHARLNLTTKRLAVDWSPMEADPGTILSAVEALGYTAYPFDPARHEAADAAESAQILRCLAVAGFAAMNIMLLSVSIWSGNVTDITPETRRFFHWISALIALPTAVYAGRPFYLSAWRALRVRSLNMDVPITIGVFLALALSVVQTVTHAPEAYYDSAVMLLFFLLVGRFLDRNMRRRTRSFAENIATLRSETAAKVLPDGSVREVPVSRIDPGDRVLAHPGERIAVDGIIEDGAADIDQSLVTGETRVERAGIGARVYAGTMNLDGMLSIRVTAAGRGTMLDEVNRLLETAAQDRSRYVQLADRAARLYAPLVHGAAAATFLFWLLWGAGWQPSLVIAISVLIITCPCALGLAIPAVQVVASGLLFRNGVLLNGGDVIERLAGVDTVVFDKTGTLTMPAPELVDSGRMTKQAMGLAGRLALTSTHPLASAVASASGQVAPLPRAREEAGRGVTANMSGRTLKLGSPEFCGVEKRRLDAFLHTRPGVSVIAFRDGDDPAVLFALTQVLRPDAVEAVNRLKRAGLAIEILSGDRPQAVGPVAETLGLEDWRAGLKPADKIARIRELQAEGRKVLMVGDGLNDAPALAAAHVSMSPVSAAHLSQAAADAVFLGDALMPIVRARAVSVAARRVMKENLALAALYNLFAVPFAVAGFVTPLIAAIAMSGSSLTVTGNALRLRWLGRGKG